ncbi:class I SAM-dependent methyltransferase [Streptomyces hirsutus]|uniref:class I SAM-dependent methyltransferase n=1 Tax=Streptomyces hirsutus TaxID=35620 RepID=UPI0033EA0C7A
MSTATLPLAHPMTRARDALQAALDDHFGADGAPRVGAGGAGGAGARGRPAPAPPTAGWVRADARALPFGPAFDLVVSFGAFGHFLPRELPGLFTQVHRVLRPGGRFAFPVVAPPRTGSLEHGMLLGFDMLMRVRNAVWRPPFVMYYRALRFGALRRELDRAGFRVELHPLPEFGRRPDGSPRVRLVVAERPVEQQAGRGPSAVPVRPRQAE